LKNERLGKQVVYHIRIYPTKAIEMLEIFINDLELIISYYRNEGRGI